MHDNFFLALHQQPENESLWLVFADYLEERGDLRAAFIRKYPVLPVPWGWVVDEGDDFVRELQREVCSTHALHGKQVVALARRFDCDDVLFWLEREDRLAVVHLTWASSQEIDPRWPSTTLFAGWGDWVQLCLKPDRRQENEL